MSAFMQEHAWLIVFAALAITGLCVLVCVELSVRQDERDGFSTPHHYTEDIDENGDEQ